jgi:YebC/PmpR family DNA-binding regulatory protein
MAGHSQFKNIMYRKSGQDAKKAKLFAKISREITVAAKLGGTDASANPRLRSILATAREHNMPKDNIERAMETASKMSGENYDDVRYEGYASSGVAVIVETLTDNRNRTASDIRSYFSKYGGNLGETGSVSFLFDRVGSIVYPNFVSSFDKIFELAINAGAENVEKTEESTVVITSVESFASVREKFWKEFGDPIESGLVFVPKVYSEIPNESKESVVSLIEILEGHDDVQRVFHNMKDE